MARIHIYLRINCISMWKKKDKNTAQKLTILLKVIPKLSSGSKPLSRSSDRPPFLVKNDAVWGSEINPFEEPGFRVTGLNPLLFLLLNPLNDFLAIWNSILRWKIADLSLFGSGSYRIIESINKMLYQNGMKWIYIYVCFCVL